MCATLLAYMGPMGMFRVLVFPMTNLFEKLVKKFRTAALMLQRLSANEMPRFPLPGAQMVPWACAMAPVVRLL